MKMRWIMPATVPCLVLGLLTFLFMAVQGAKSPILVTCGSVVKLKSDKTGHMLQSMEVNYGTGSGQQAVTGSNAQESADSMWIVRGGYEHCEQGAPVRKNSMIRLQHMTTRRMLHSHLFQSPLSAQQEVSCFGSDTESDTGDVWVIEWDGKHGFWERDAAVRLKHKDTDVYLSNHAKQYQRPISGHTEVFGSKKKGTETLFRAGEGVYFSAKTETK